MKKNIQNDHSSSLEDASCPAEELSPKQVALALGVSEASLKRWCDNGLLDSTRTAGGHRRISRGSVMAFLREREQPAVRPELLGLPTATGHGAWTTARVLDEVQAALEAGSEARLRLALFNFYLAKHSVHDICDTLIAPAFHRIGTNWVHGKTEIFEERRAGEVCARVLHELRTRLPVLPPTAPMAIGGALQNDPYSLAPAMAELVLREAGWDAENFGVNIPVTSFCTAIRKQKPRLVWISVGCIADQSAFISGIKMLFTTVRKHGGALALGGRAVTPEVRNAVPYSAYCESFRELASFAEALRDSTP